MLDSEVLASLETSANPVSTARLAEELDEERLGEPLNFSKSTSILPCTVATAALIEFSRSFFEKSEELAAEAAAIEFGLARPVSCFFLMLSLKHLEQRPSVAVEPKNPQPAAHN